MRFGTAGAASWSLLIRVTGEGGVKLLGPKYRINLGRYPEVSLSEARAKAVVLPEPAKRGVNPKEALTPTPTAGVAAMRHDNVALKALLAHDAEADLPNVFRVTPLMAACGMSGSGRGNGPEPGNVDVQAGAIETVELLLKGGAELVAYVRGRDHEGQTALFAAAESGWNKVVADLLGRGADPAVRDDDRKTALDYAQHPPAAFAGRGAQQGPRTKSEDAGRAATVALFQAALTKPGADVDTAALLR